VCNQECRPTNLQLDRIEVLNTDLKKGQDTFDKLYMDYNTKATATIKDEKMKASKSLPVNNSN